MYRVAVDKARGLSKMEPVAICNYGIFLYNQRKDAERAVELLQDGLLRLRHFLLIDICTYNVTISTFLPALCNDILYVYSILSYPGHRGLVKNYAHMTGAKNGKGPLMIKN